MIGTGTTTVGANTGSGNANVSANTGIGSTTIVANVTTRTGIETQFPGAVVVQLGFDYTLDFGFQ